MAAAKHIGIVLFPDVEELDAVGPWEVLAAWTRSFPDDGYTVSCLSRFGGLVQCAKGLALQAHYSFADVPKLEVLVYPGGQGTRSQLQDRDTLDWVRRQRADVPLMTSVCTGSLVYAAAGLLSLSMSVITAGKVCIGLVLKGAIRTSALRGTSRTHRYHPFVTLARRLTANVTNARSRGS